MADARASLTVTRTTGGGREWAAQADTRDLTAGGTWTVTVSNTPSGLTPVANADTLTLTLRTHSGSIVRQVTLAPTAATQTVTVAATVDGISGSSGRAGTYYLDVRATKGGVEPYDVGTEDPSGSPGVGYQAVRDRGLIRSSTTLVSLTAEVGGQPATLLAYPDQPTLRATLQHPANGSMTLTYTLGPRVGGASLAGGSTVATAPLGTIDTAYPAAATTYRPTVNSGDGPTGLRILLLSNGPQGADVTVDPRLYRQPLFQVDDDTFGTPPSSKHQPLQRRLTSQQGFLGSRTMNARREGVNGVAYTVSLNPRKPGTPVTATSLTTATRGGEAGWSPTLLPWDSQLPGGLWDKVVTITSPAGYGPSSGYVVQEGSTVYTLVALDPDVYAEAVAGNPYATARHFSPGDPLMVGGLLAHAVTGQSLVPEAPPTCALFRVGAGLLTESLHADGTWRPLRTAQGAADPVEWLPMVETPAGSGQYAATWAPAVTATWGTADVSCRIRLVYGGASYFANAYLTATGTPNGHDAYRSDGAAFLGLGGSK